MIKTEFPGYMKDDTPGQVRAVLNIDNNSLVAYKAARRKEQALTEVVNDIDNLKRDMADIKDLLTKLVNGKQ